MLQLKPLTEFFTAIGSDPRINTTHITLYMGLLKFWFDQDCKNPVYVYFCQVMQLCKISGNATYHKCIQELNNYGYIKYSQSYNRTRKSLIYLLNIENKYYRTYISSNCI